MVAEGLLSYLARDLRTDLGTGFQRTPAISPNGCPWLVRWALISTLVGLTLFLLCGYQGGFTRLNTFASRLPDPVWEWLTVFGDERLVFALTLFFTRRYPRVFWALIVAALFGIAITHSIKPLVSALRPPAVLEPGSFHLIGPRLRKASFPSGHTVTAAIFFGVWVCYVRVCWFRMALVIFAIMVGLSRVAVGVHWPVDVAAGLASGVMAAWLGVFLARRGERFAGEPSIHLALVTAAAMMAMSLMMWDGGYQKAAVIQRLVAIAALGYATCVYLIAPLQRWRQAQRDGG